MWFKTSFEDRSSDRCLCPRAGSAPAQQSCCCWKLDSQSKGCRECSLLLGSGPIISCRSSSVRRDPQHSVVSTPCWTNWGWRNSPPASEPELMRSDTSSRGRMAAVSPNTWPGTADTALKQASRLNPIIVSGKRCFWSSFVKMWRKRMIMTGGGGCPWWEAAPTTTLSWTSPAPPRRRGWHYETTTLWNIWSQYSISCYILDIIYVYVYKFSIDIEAY